MNALANALKRGYWDCRFSCGPTLSKLGERMGIDALTYNPVVMDLFGHIAAQAAPVFAQQACAQFPHAASVVDLGCGTGHFVHAFRARGLRAYGFERSGHARQYALTHLQTDIADFDLRDRETTIPRVDLAMSLEVVEHLPESLGSRMLDLLTAAAPIILFSGAHPGQGGMGHVNEQPQEYWIERFAYRGFRLDGAATDAMRACLARHAPLAPWLAVNTMVFRHAGAA